MTYLFILIGILGMPLIIALTPKFRFYLNRRLAKTLILTALPFIFWDWWATKEGHWSFNQLHTLGINFAGLPVEEIAFFFVTPFACLLLYVAADKYLPKTKITLPVWFWSLFMIGTTTALLMAFPKPYSSVVFCLSGFVIVLIYRHFRAKLPISVLFYFVASFVFFFLFNSILTALPVVSYADWAILNLRIGTIPIEDFWYNFLLISLALIIYSKMSNQVTSAQSVFKKGSTTYYNASQFFSPKIKDQVTTLYAFVRVADNFVDQLPQQRHELESFLAEYRRELLSPSGQSSVIADFVLLMKKTNIKPDWVEAFLASMIQDFSKKEYANMSELEKYIYGSAEVIGLMMARIFGLSDKHYVAAAKLGKAMQYCNIIRDIDEDLNLGRIYLPQSTLRKFKLHPFSKKMAQKKPKQFRLLMQQEISRCLQWFSQAEQDFDAIPRRERVVVKTATAMYQWTLEKLYQNPQLVFQKKLKPSKLRVILTAVKYGVII